MQIFLTMFGNGIVVGPGTNRMSMVHILDLAALTVLVLQRALSGTDENASPYAKYYFATTREEQQKDLAAATVGALVSLGKIERPDLRQISVDDASVMFPYPL
jgi:hypothetical protein